MSEGDEEKPPEEGGEEEEEGGGEEAAESESKEGEEVEEGSVSSSQKGSVIGSGSVGSRSTQYSEGSRSLSIDIELLSNEVRELKDFIGVQYERLFSVAKDRKVENLPKTLQLVEEKEMFLERLQNPDLIALLIQTFKRAERGSFAPRQFQKGIDYLEVLKNDCAKFERYLYEMSEAIASLEGYINKRGEEAPADIVKYKEVLEDRAEKLNSVTNLLMKFVIQESCLDSYLVELDLARAYSLVKEQSDHIEKLLDYIDLQRKHMDPDSHAFREWSRIHTEKEPLNEKVEERLKTVEGLGNHYSNLEEDEKDLNVVRLIRKHMEELLRNQSLYIQKLRNCVESQAPYVYEDDEIPDTTEIAAEGTYISKYVDEWLMFNGIELNNETKEDTELVVLNRLREELERYIADLNSELEEMGGAATKEEAAEEEAAEEEAAEEEIAEEETAAEEVREGLVEWLANNKNKKEYLAKMVEELTAELATIDKNKQTVERRAIYGEKKVPKKPRRMPKMTEMGSVESLDMPDTVVELKDFCKDLVQKYNCLFKVYTLRMNLNDEKRRQEKLREAIDKVIESKHARKRGIQFEMQLRSAYATIEALKRTLKENKKKAKEKFEELKGKLDAALEKSARLQDELGSFQSKMTVKTAVPDPAAAVQRK